jgi:hypothetical protein
LIVDALGNLGSYGAAPRYLQPDPNGIGMSNSFDAAHSNHVEAHRNTPHNPFQRVCCADPLRIVAIE